MNLKDIPGYECIYQARSDGMIWSVRNKLWRIPRLDKDGYYRVNLSVKGKRTTERINRLIAKTFLSNPKNLPDVNHKDGDKRNNNINNLEWCTKKYNRQHAWKNGLANMNRNALGQFV